MKTKRHDFYNEFNKLVNLYDPNFKIDGEAKMTSVLLFKDALRRINEWRLFLNSSETRYICSDDFNLFNKMDADWKNELEDYETYVTYLKAKSFNFSRRNYMYLFIYLFICWEQFKDREEIKKFKLDNPYEPLMKIFKNRNLIYLIDGFQINGIRMIMYKLVKLPSLDDQFLDYIDSKCKFSLSTGIPNQEEIDEMWADYLI